MFIFLYNTSTYTYSISQKKVQTFYALKGYGLLHFSEPQTLNSNKENVHNLRAFSRFCVRYLGTSKNLPSTASCWGEITKPLKNHIGHPILTNVGRRHLILPWFLTIPHPHKVGVLMATLMALHLATPD